MRTKLRTRPSIAQMIAGVGLVALLTGCQPEAGEQGLVRDDPAAEAPLPAEVEASPEVYRGSGLARQVCARCHVVAEGNEPLMDIGAPSFVDVANRPGTTLESLETWLRIKHPSMPNYRFDDESTTDLAAYVLSLRQEP